MFVKVVSYPRHLLFLLQILCNYYPFDKIHSDLWEPAPIVSVDKYRYYVTSVDDRTRFIWFYPLHNKSDFYSIFIRFEKFVEKQFSSKISFYKLIGVDSPFLKDLGSVWLA